jgi:hypothetical protein
MAGTAMPPSTRAPTNGNLAAAWPPSAEGPWGSGFHSDCRDFATSHYLTSLPKKGILFQTVKSWAKGVDFMNTKGTGAFCAAVHHRRGKRVGELLVEEGLVSGLDLARALLHQKEYGGKIIDILVAMRATSTQGVISFLARQPGIPSIRLRNYNVHRKTVSLVPKELAVKHEVFPVETLGQVLTLAMVCPLDRQAILDLEKVTEFKIRPILCSPDDIRAAINHYYARKEMVTLSWLSLEHAPSCFGQARGYK